MNTIARIASAALLVVITVLTIGIGPAAAHPPPVTVYCKYKVVTGGSLLSVRSHHDLNSSIVNSIPNGSLVIAGRDGTATGSGLTWRQVFPSGPQGWSATQYLQRTSDPCFN